MAADKDSGRELFTREWLPDDPRSAKGDGLGPMFNDTSCAACHNQGGVGGSGPASKNVQVASAFSGGIEVNGGTTNNGPNFSFGTFGFKFDEGGNKKDRTIAKADKAEAKAKTRIASEREQLGKIHPGLLTSRSVVLHRFSTDPAYASFRDGLTSDGLAGGIDGFAGGFDGKFQFGNFDNAFDFVKKLSGQAVADRADLPKLSAEQSAELQRLAQQPRLGGFFHLLGQRQIGNIVLLISERNTPPLFGAGLIDAIPDSVLIHAAKARHPGYPEVSGRVARQKDGKLGRFGWKSQKVDLREFTLNACAMELGLDVPTQPQAMVPHKPDYVAPGLDLTEEQCNELVAFVSELPRPQQVVPGDEKSTRSCNSRHS